MIFWKPFEIVNQRRAHTASLVRLRAVLLWRHSKLKQLFLLGLVVVLAAGGQGFLNHGRLWVGALLYGITLVLLALTARPATAIRPADPLNGLTSGLQLRRGAVRGLGLAAAVGALAFSGLAYWAFGAQLTRAWSYYVAGLAYVLVAALLLTRGKGLGHLWPRTRLTRGLLALVLLLAFVLRLWQLGSLPAGTWYDEALSGLQGAQWNADPAFRPQFQNNNPGQIMFLYAMALRWFGHGTSAIRLVPAVLGLAGVLAAYLLGSELRGPRFGLAMAFFVAVARWHVTFSRIAMTGIDTPLFVFGSLFFLTRLLRGGSLRDAVGAGVSLGLGLSAYSAFRLFVLAMGLFAFLSLCFWRAWRPHLRDGRGWLRLGVRLGALALALWLAALPVIHFGLTEPAAFWNRVHNTSLLFRRDEPDLVVAIGRSTRQHLLMFNLAGDRNGRHNLYGAPILDPAMGVLLILGLGLALARMRQPENLFFMILFPVGLLGGILSLDFEAPQSLRSIAALPAVIYFCALSLNVLVDRVRQGLRLRLSAAWRAVPVVALGMYIPFANAHTYFFRQAGDYTSWSAFSTAESLAGRRMAELGPEYRFYLSPLFSDHPSIRFLSPETHDRRVLTLPDALPIRQPADRPAALFIHPDDAWAYGAAQSLYPGGSFETVFDPAGRTAVLYVVTLARSDVARVQGLELRYWVGQDGEGNPQTALRVGTVDGKPLDQLDSSALPALLQDEGLAEWSGVLYAPAYGPYRLFLSAPAGATLDLGGRRVLEVVEGGEGAVSCVLAQGNHLLRMRAPSGPGRVRLSWQPPSGQAEVVPQWALYAPPVTGHGLLGNYYGNAAWEGTPVLARIDPFLDAYLHLTPLPRPYSAEWLGALQAPRPGAYQLGLRAVDWAQLMLDGQVVVETNAPGVDAVATVTLSQGPHDLRLRFRDTVERSRLHLLWRPPGQESLTAVPSQYLWPSPAGYGRSALVEHVPPKRNNGDEK